MTSPAVQQIDQFSRSNPKFAPTGEILKTYMRGGVKIESAQKAILKFLNSSTGGNLSSKAKWLTKITRNSEDFYPVDYKEELDNAISDLFKNLQKSRSTQCNVIPTLEALIRKAEEIDQAYHNPDFGGCTIL